jgi:hypothetical protein
MAEMTKHRAGLLADLEKMVASFCHNGSIQNWGAGGVFQGEGRTFRYPLTVESGLGEKRKVHGRVNHLKPDDLMTGYYEFGANRLQIVVALDAVLRHLEDEYELDFNF